MTEKFTPVNPFNMSEPDQRKYFDDLSEIRGEESAWSTPYKGSEIFNTFVKDKKIGVGAIVRVHYFSATALNEHFIVVQEGLRHVTGKVYEAEEVLNTGEFWNIEGHEFIGDESESQMKDPL